MKGKKVIILGGGLAGLTSAIHLSRKGIHVVLIEKNSYPKHKVCGEYISNEVLPYLNWLEIPLLNQNPTQINKLEFSTATGKTMECKLPLGGFGISRYVLDKLLFKKAVENGCQIIKDTVDTVNFENNKFIVKTTENNIFTGDVVLGAFGKRSTLDINLKRKFVQEKSNYLAVKAHYMGDFPNDLVGLHNFDGGYCGVSKVENNKINICYLANYKSFKKYKNIQDYQENNVMKNPHLQNIFENCTIEFDKPITISQISFKKKKIIENNILMIGDTAGLIHPLCGNGMAMAIHSAKIASELIIDYSNNLINSREGLEKLYVKKWNYNFKSRMRTARFIAYILRKQKLANVLLSTLIIFPFLMPIIIKKTHGKPITL